MLTIISGNHLRHIFLVKKISKVIPIENWIIQKRQNSLTNSYKKKVKLTKLEKIHYKKRASAEKFFFTSAEEISHLQINNIIEIKKENLESKKFISNIKKLKRSNLITYGCNKINDNVLKLFPGNKWNVHAGLSPWYRGSATHFWPTFLLEPDFTGVTLHNLTNEIDGGEIIHQTKVKLNANDGIHENACRCISDFCTEFVNLINKDIFKKKLKGITQSSSGRIWTKKMWHPYLLNSIYNFYDDKINKFCLNNKNLRKINLKSVLK